ncbi:RNA 3'-terminal phosphate cyclase [Methanothermobacter tenebrarum]|uniref:RNA 3'-terminal phosphate cyclase n=1 Tax=Methanothermobacter tenebrarum TaxID=680118 RepID=A0A328PH52_9EURY|nr:RNA 3'-terminal phosphate cyclase [Methanothermobacter tenebrarum]MBC7100507.1 RNA 3'-terminal phosphate cyclase [Methanobacteriales archaeon]MBC7117822.1 RNA 3'-terminal phosphate cyclase [Methanobacteriaceae archaeon]NPV64240.1 RNA 3'-terminal phosphate cyclase [Methanobacteriaceae archaeon]RAO79852.1 RNA 3'-phosphate cyclase [Methanothermobacter tenebrarum]
MLEIDGSFGEGGGALVRISTALAALTSTPIKIYNIRANRPKKGLSYQHLTAIKALAKITEAKLEGAEIGSTEIKFTPQKIKGGNFYFDVKTAGSIGLVLQALMIPAAFAEDKTTFKIRGGTDVKWSPPINYLENVTLPLLEKMGYKGKIKLLKRGYYPKGGGIIEARIQPIKRLKPIKLTKTRIKSIKGISHAGRLPLHVAERQARAAQKILQENGLDAEIRIEHSNDTLSPGSGIILWAEGNTRIGASSLGEKGKPAEIVGKEAAEELIRFLEEGAPIDKYMGDQIIPYMSIAGKSIIKTVEFSMHAYTNIHVTEKITGKKFKVKGDLGKPATIECP